MSNSIQCSHCQMTITSDYCGGCGHPRQINRIDGSYIKSELASIFYFDKGIFFTIKELLVRPGESIRIFLLRDRQYLVKPLVFLLVTSLIYTLTESIFQFEQGVTEQEGLMGTTAGDLTTWVQTNYGYANILMSVFIVLFVKLFFRKYIYNMVEIYIVICYVMGMGMLFFTIIGTLSVGLKGGSLLQVGGLLAMLYCGVAIGSFYDRTKIINYVKALLAYVIGMFAFYAVVYGIGMAIDTVIK